MAGWEWNEPAPNERAVREEPDGSTRATFEGETRGISYCPIIFSTRLPMMGSLNFSCW